MPATITLTNVTGTQSLPAVLQFSSAVYSASENASQAMVTVTRSGGIDSAVSVSYSTSDGTGQARVHYRPASGTLTFAQGEASKRFAVGLVNDRFIEGVVTVNLALSNALGGAGLDGNVTSVLMIYDDDLSSNDNQNQIELLYNKLLERPADPAGLTMWTEMLDNGISLYDVVLAIENKLEYRLLAVQKLYRTLLQRESDLPGWA